MKVKIKFLPDELVVEGEEGSSLLEAARRAGYSLQSECGGQGTCRRCKVRLLTGQVFTVGKPNLTAAEQKKNIILACLSRLQEDIKIQILPRSELILSRMALSQEWSPGEHPGQEILVRGMEIKPLAIRLSLDVPPPTLQNNSSDLDRLIEVLPESKGGISYHATSEVLRKLSTTLRQTQGSVSVLLNSGAEGDEIIDITPPTSEPLFGLVFDIGTTTLVVRLLNLETGEVAAEAADFNWQIPCGADVIHRIIYAAKPNGLTELQRLVLEAGDGLIGQMLETCQAQREQIVAAVVAGNTTMEHLFLGLDPHTIREEPYVPTVTHFPVLKAGEIGLKIFPRAPVYISPAVASYVGGDITAGLVAAGVHLSEQLCLYVDLGTNGEVALGNRDWLTACACSAGPAFEGSGVQCGMRALPGAIDQAQSDRQGHLTFHVIGGGSPRGICGSGLIDLLAQLRCTGRLNARGKLNHEADPDRIRSQGRRLEYLVVPAAETEGGGDLAISENDLDNLIRTKGAIFAGLMTLLKGVGLDPTAIERVVIAGGFGRYLNIESAIRIGMLPDLPRERFEYIGNGSLRGAGLALLSPQVRAELEAISRRITYFELSTWPGYMDEFMAALFLPHTDASLFPSVKNS